MSELLNETSDVMEDQGVVLATLQSMFVFMNSYIGLCRE